MNDADLEKLAVKPGVLVPKFDRNVTAYKVQLESSTKSLTIAPATRDQDASWMIVGLGTVRQVPLNDGEEKDVVIEVTAEDGTAKRYTVTVSVSSASNASLSDIKLSNGSLSPQFKHDVFEYRVDLPWYLPSVKVLPEAIDRLTGGANECEEVLLNYGDTQKALKIVSPDETRVKVYTIKFVKDKISRQITPKLHDSTIYCSICLGVIHCSVSMRNEKTIEKSNKVIACKACVEMITRTRKINPFTEASLPVDFIVEEIEFERELATKRVFCCYKSAGCEEEMELSKLGTHMKGCGFKPIVAAKFDAIIPYNQAENPAKMSTCVCSMCSRGVGRDEACTHLQLYCPSKYPNTKFEHIVKLREWERKLQQANASTDNIEEIQVNEKDDACQLKTAAESYAGVIKMKPRDPMNHFKLATVMEEMYYAKEIWGIAEEAVEENDDEKIFEDLMDIASDSSKEEEISAICKAKCVRQNAPLAAILRALDQEYHELLNENHSAKADYVQKLYAWKSKQSTEGKGQKIIESDDECLERALWKVLDASACDKNNSFFHMHAGRLLLMQGRYEDAVKRLEAAFGLKPTCIESKFYLGLAYAKFYPKNLRQKFDTLKYLQDGIDFVLHDLCEKQQPVAPVCSTRVFVRYSNVLILEGMLELANVLNEHGSPTGNDISRTIGVYRLTSSLCFQLLSKITQKNKIYKQLQWVALRAQFSIGTIKSRIAKTNKDIEGAGKYWERLSALSRAFDLPTDDDIMQLQEKICEESVLLCPASCRALYRLGDAQLALYDNASEALLQSYKNNNRNRSELLNEAERSYRASLQFEGKSVNGTEHSMSIKDSVWFKMRRDTLSNSKHLKAQNATAATTSPSKPKQGTGKQGSQVSSSSAVKPSQAKAAAAKGATDVKRGSIEVKKRNLTEKKGRPAASPSKFQGTGSSSSTFSSKKSGSKLAKTSASAHSSSCSIGKSAAEGKPKRLPLAGQVPNGNNGKEIKTGKNETENETDSKQVQMVEKENALNEVSYQARLGLARTLSKSQNACYWAEVKDLYNQVMEMVPSLHDAYIELGEMVANTEPRQAVEIYSRYPFSKEGNFDDAYLYGEIIRLVMKMEDYDNPNLKKGMIGYGKVMGFSSLEKTIAVLEEKSKIKILKDVYAEINGKDVNDEELQNFFKFKCWI